MSREMPRLCRLEYRTMQGVLRSSNSGYFCVALWRSLRQSGLV